MKILHRVGLNVDVERQRRLAALGIEAALGPAAFDWDESDPNWPELARLIAEWRAFDMARTETTHAERAAAAQLSMWPAWHHGYPMPDNDNGYLSLTFDLTHYCSECGIGAVQKAPFRMRGEPKWGKRGILQLNWIFDEYFARPDVWREVFKPFGISFRPVLKYKTDTPLETVVQLVVDTLSDTPLRMGDHPFQYCLSCQREKYLPFARGCFPPFASEGNASSVPMTKTQEYFGDGAKAFRQVIVNHAMYAAIVDHRVSGNSFLPVCGS